MISCAPSAQANLAVHFEFPAAWHAGFDVRPQPLSSVLGSFFWWIVEFLQRGLVRSFLSAYRRRQPRLAMTLGCNQLYG